jgi:hypothetical protein
MKEKENGGLGLRETQFSWGLFPGKQKGQKASGQQA